jgi:hypothetical protein
LPSGPYIEFPDFIAPVIGLEVSQILTTGCTASSYLQHAGWEPLPSDLVPTKAIGYGFFVISCSLRGCVAFREKKLLIEILLGGETKRGMVRRKENGNNLVMIFLATSNTIGKS